MAYPNGRIPLAVLVHLGGNHYLPPGTAARWRWLVEQAFAKYGIRLRITPGWNGYRPYVIQVEYRTKYGIWAAVAGRSSHGGTYNGREVFAIDVDNWAQLGWARFAALCRLAGFTVDFVSPREQWHIGDFNDAWIIPTFASGGGGSHINPAPAPKPAPAIAEPELIMEELMPFKSVTIAYRPQDGVDALESVSLDWEDGATLNLHNTKESYHKSFAEGFTQGGLKILTKGNYDYVLQKFAEHQAEMRERELSIARAGAGR